MPGGVAGERSVMIAPYADLGAYSAGVKFIVTPLMQ